jgi:hypothetical protein
MTKAGKKQIAIALIAFSWFPIRILWHIIESLIN